MLALDFYKKNNQLHIQITSPVGALEGASDGKLVGLGVGLPKLYMYISNNKYEKLQLYFCT